METNVEKMQIIALKPDGEEAGKNYTVLVNPEKYSIGNSITWKAGTPSGRSGTELKYDKTKPSDLSFTFLFDNTGSIKADTPSVKEQVEAFLAVVYDFDGEIHEPFLVKLVWGDLIFKGKLTTIKLNYELFNRQGVALRAQADATFKSSIQDKLLQAKENKSSPDLTHQRTVKEGDTLPLMTERIYGNAKHYLEVAKFNQLKQFRTLQPGTQISFPPLEK